jgi:hypothetical protein
MSSLAKPSHSAFRPPRPRPPGDLARAWQWSLQQSWPDCRPLGAVARRSVAGASGR